MRARSVLSVAAVLLAAFVAVQAEEIVMQLGDTKQIPLPGSFRSGDYPKNLVTGTHGDNWVVLRAIGVGSAPLMIETDHGSVAYDLTVVPPVGRDAQQTIDEVKKLLKDVEGLQYETVGDRVVVSGQLRSIADRALYDKVLELYPEVIDLVKSIDLLIEVSVLVVEVNRTGSTGMGLLDFDDVTGQIGGTGTISIAPKADPTATITWAVSGEVTKAIHGLVESNQARIKSSPRLVLTNGKTGRILVGGSIPYQVSTSTSTDVQWQDYGITLEVTPRQKMTNEISLELNIQASEPSNVDYKGLPGLNKREVKLDVSVENGKTLAIAGLFNDISGSGTRVGCLFPIFGVQSNSTKKETWVLVTPKAPADLSPGDAKIIPQDEFK